MSKRVGIVIPSYNQGPYIEETIRSVLDNRRHADIKIAVMDGGSADDTVSIIQKYEADFEIWRSEPDKGQAHAINKGIAVLKDCDYYMWLNSDDLYEDEFAVQKIVDYAESRKLDVCYGLSHFIDKDGKIIGDYPVEEFDKAALGKRCYLSQPSVIFSRTAYETIGPLNESLRMCLDYEYWMRLAQKYTFGLVREYIGCTRMYEDTKTATMQQRHFYEAMQIMMRYYQKVPAHWVAAKLLADYPQGIIQHIPKRLLYALVYPFRGYLVGKWLKGNADDTDNL